VKLRIVVREIWCICSPVLKEGEDSLLETFLDRLDDKGDSAADGFRALFGYVVDHPQGPMVLSTELSHEICKQESIWQFIKGRWRIPWFHGGEYENHEKLIICLEGFRKTTGRTPRSEIDKAKAVKAAFEKARASGELIIEDDSPE